MEPAEPPPSAQDLALENLLKLPFIQDVSQKPARTRPEDGNVISIRADGELFKFRAMHFSSFLGAEILAQIRVWGEEVRVAKLDPPLVLARYISPPAAQQLSDGQISFVDSVGNYHLKFGDKYNWMRLGIRDRPVERPKLGRDRVEVQLLLQFVTNPAALAWTVRRLADGAGVSKSAAALILRRLDPKRRAKEDETLGGEILDAERFRTAVSGYGRVVRPKILIGTFRPPKKSTMKDVLTALLLVPEVEIGRYSVTGRLAAHILGHPEPVNQFPIFVEDWHSVVSRLQLEPDPKGPIVLLRFFGSVVYGRIREGFVIAPIPLIIGELLASKDSKDRALADTMQRDFLRDRA